MAGERGTLAAGPLLESAEVEREWEEGAGEESPAGAAAVDLVDAAGLGLGVVAAAAAEPGLDVVAAAAAEPGLGLVAAAAAEPGLGVVAAAAAGLVAAAAVGLVAAAAYFSFRLPLPVRLSFFPLTGSI